MAASSGIPTFSEISMMGLMSFLWVRAAQFGRIFIREFTISRASASVSA